MKLKALISTIFLSFISSSTVIAAPEKSNPYRKFIVYYGWYSDGREMGPELERIIAAKPEFVISPYHTSSNEVNLTPEVITKFHENGIKAIVYIATGNGNRNLEEEVLLEIKTGLDNGADGVMLDEVPILHSDQEVNYYKKVYDYAKSFGNEKLVIANPGSILVNERVMSVSDIVSFEHQWRLAPQVDWVSKYTSTRFMGISSNDVTDVMGYKVDEGVASRDTIEAWQAGIGYHFSTNSYTSLAPWFEEYQMQLKTMTLPG